MDISILCLGYFNGYFILLPGIFQWIFLSPAWDISLQFSYEYLQASNENCNDIGKIHNEISNDITLTDITQVPNEKCNDIGQTTNEN